MTWSIALVLSFQPCMSVAKGPSKPAAYNQLPAVLQILSNALEQERDASYAAWLERYLRYETPSRGVRIPRIRAAVSHWYSKDGSNILTLSANVQRSLSVQLLKLPTVEDKLAGTVLIQDSLIPGGIVSSEHLEMLGAVFDEGYIHDWHCCDWFCVRVLSQLVEKEGDCAIQKVSDWHNCDNVWRARCSLVALLPIVHDSAHYHIINRVADVLIRREERFAKTAVGWVLREVGKHDKKFVKTFLNSHLQFFSTEAFKKVAKVFTDKEQRAFTKKMERKPARNPQNVN